MNAMNLKQNKKVDPHIRPEVDPRLRKKRVPYLTTITGPSHDIHSSHISENMDDARPYQPVNNNNFLAIIQNCGPERNYFLQHRARHSYSLSDWIYRNRASAVRLGRETCYLFNVKPYSPVNEADLDRKRLLDKIKEVEHALKMLDQRKRIAAEKGYLIMYLIILY